MYTLPEGHGVTPIKGGIQEAKTGCNGLLLCGEVARRDKDQIVHSNKACYGVFVRSLRKKTTTKNNVWNDDNDDREKRVEMNSLLCICPYFTFYHCFH